jgi:hypothetical protein
MPHGEQKRESWKWRIDEELRNGVLISIDEQRSRARILPF